MANKSNLQYLLFCIGNFYFWQALTTIGFCHFLRRLADKFPAPPPIIAIDSPVDVVGPSMQQFLEEKEAALTDATSKIDNLDREKAGLRAKVSRLEAEVDFITKDRYSLVCEKISLENRLGDFNSWPEFRIEFDRLTTEFIAMQSQRAREHLLQERYLEIAKEARAELAAAKQAETMSKIAHSKELEQAQQQRDEAMEKYRILLATTTAANTTPAATAADVTTTTSPVTNAAATIPVVKGNSPGDVLLQDENTRLTLALRSKSSLLAQKSSDLGRMQSLLRTRSENSAGQLEKTASTIASLEEDKTKAEARIAELERDLQKAKNEAEQMEGMYMAVAFRSEDEAEGVEKKKKEEEEGSGGEKAEGSWLLGQIEDMGNEEEDEEEEGEDEEDDDDGSDGGGDSDDDHDGEDDGDDDDDDDEEEDGGGEGEEEEGDED